MADAGEERGVIVAIRMRPLNERERAGEQAKVWRCLPAYNSITQTSLSGQPLPDAKGSTFFTYDRIFDEGCSNDEVYAGAARDLVQSVVRGLNGTIFAYGQTSSGKTFTMQGARGGEVQGIAHKATADIFAVIGNTAQRDFLLRVSYLEIYNEEIRDLLNPDTPKLQLREDPRKGVYVDSREEIVTDFETVIRALRFGERQRHVDATAMNERSSRSHTIFRMVVESKERFTPGVHETEADVDDAVLVATLNLVDLAGSESVRHTGATGARQKEGGKINQSLLSLSRVIQVRVTSDNVHVNYRDSKLTRILQPSLSGNASMAIVACVTPAEAYTEETRSTLQFAQRAKLIKTRAVVNEVLDERAQLKRLKREL
ncbi:kinesin family-like protein, partial [Tribonema minus]